MSSDSQTNIGSKVLIAVFGAWVIGAAILTPYYNWQYAQSEGFARWVLWGEVASTFKGVAWPYFVFRNHSKSQDDSVESKRWPPLNASELDTLSKIFAKTSENPLTDTDINELRSVLKEYGKRTGRPHVPKEQEQFLVESMKISCDYQYELSRSALFSWDEKQVFRTEEFDRLYKIEKKEHLRKEELLDFDLRTLQAAAQNLDYIEAQDGARYRFSREDILQTLKQIEIWRANLKKVAAVFAEFSK